MTIDIQSIKQMFNHAEQTCVPLDDLITHGQCQQRLKTNPASIKEYAEAMLANGKDTFPPLLCVKLNEPIVTEENGLSITHDVGTLILVDGYQRLEAATSIKCTEFHVKVAEGSLEDAVYYSMGANSSHGDKPKGKDLQNAIKNLYALNDYWRQHGRKQELQALLGCSESTVTRACKAIDKEVKAQAFNMFSEGKRDEEVSEFAHKDIKTVARWREEWEQLPKDEPEAPEQEPQGEPEEPTGDVMQLTLRQILSLKDPDMKRKAFTYLLNEVSADEATAKLPEEPEEPEASPELQLDLLGDTWSYLGKPREYFEGVASPKRAIMSAASRMLKQHAGNQEIAECITKAREEALGLLG